MLLSKDDKMLWFAGLMVTSKAWRDVLSKTTQVTMSDTDKVKEDYSLW